MGHDGCPVRWLMSSNPILMQWSEAAHVQAEGGDTKWGEGGGNGGRLGEGIIKGEVRDGGGVREGDGGEVRGGDGGM